jgi:hypothetical protein
MIISAVENCKRRIHIKRKNSATGVFNRRWRKNGKAKWRITREIKNFGRIGKIRSFLALPEEAIENM